jgi:hypothetical protein
MALEREGKRREEKKARVSDKEKKNSEVDHKDTTRGED